MIYIVALGVSFKCPRKIHLNTQCPPSCAITELTWRFRDVRYLIVLQINLYCKFSTNFPQKIYFHSVTDVKVNHINRYSSFCNLHTSMGWKLISMKELEYFHISWYVIRNMRSNIQYTVYMLGGVKTACKDPSHFCKLNVATSRMAFSLTYKFYKLPLQIQTIDGAL